jgi:hypothetical protein
VRSHRRDRARRLSPNGVISLIGVRVKMRSTSAAFLL